MNFIKKYWFTFSIVISLVLGSIIGAIASDITIEYIKPFGDLFINLMFTLVVPLVFFTITSSIASLSRKLKLSSILLKTILVFFITSIVSAVFMTGIMLFFNPSNGTILLENSTTEASSNVLSKIVSAISVNDFYNLLSKNLKNKQIFQIHY